MPALKEPHFFSDDYSEKRRIDDLDQYESLFASAPDQTLCGEASVWYLYSTQAVRAIMTYEPQAKLIVMLRDPVSMVPSMHNQALFSRIEDETDFETAWGLEGQRRAGTSLPKRHQGREFLYYSKIARYAEQLKRAFEYAPHAQVKIILYDDFKADAGGVYAETLEFLAIPHDGRDTFLPVNEAQTARLQWLTDVVSHPPGPLTLVKAAIQRMTGMTRGEIGRMVRRLNRRPQHRTSISPNLARNIRVAYADDVERLESLIGRDLSAWRSND